MYISNLQTSSALGLVSVKLCITFLLIESDIKSKCNVCSHSLRSFLVRAAIRELTLLGRERRPRLHNTKTAITEIRAVQLCRKHNLKDLLSE